MQHVYNSDKLRILHDHLKIVIKGARVAIAKPNKNAFPLLVEDDAPIITRETGYIYYETKEESLDRIIKELDLLVKQVPEELVKFHSRKFAEAYARMKAGEIVFLKGFAFSMDASGDIIRHSRYGKADNDVGYIFYPEEVGYIFDSEDMFSDKWRFKVDQNEEKIK